MSSLPTTYSIQQPWGSRNYETLSTFNGGWWLVLIDKPRRRRGFPESTTYICENCCVVIEQRRRYVNNVAQFDARPQAIRMLDPQCAIKNVAPGRRWRAARSGGVGLQVG